jgi:hypothetical protein
MGLPRAADRKARRYSTHTYNSVDHSSPIYLLIHCQTAQCPTAISNQPLLYNPRVGGLPVATPPGNPPQPDTHAAPQFWRHCTISNESSLSRVRNTESVSLLLLKILSHSADVAGTARMSLAIPNSPGYRSRFFNHQAQGSETCRS